MYEALTGVRPFEGDSALGILMAHVRSPVPELPAGCPASPEMRALVRHMLAKEPGRRPSALELVKAFEQIRITSAGRPAAGPVQASGVVGVAGPSWREAETVCLISPAGGEVLAAPADGNETIEIDGLGEPDRTLAMEPPRLAEPGSRRGGGVTWAMAGLAVVVLAGLGAFLWTTGDPAQSDPVQEIVVASVAVEPPSPVPTPAPETAEKPAPVPAVRVRFESSPSGARVFDASDPARDLGVTPFEADWPGPQSGKRFVFRLNGHPDEVVVADVKAGAVVIGTLKPRLVAPAASKPRRVPAPTPTPAPAPAPAPVPAPRKFRPVVD